MESVDVLAEVILSGGGLFLGSDDEVSCAGDGGLAGIVAGEDAGVEFGIEVGVSAEGEDAFGVVVIAAIDGAGAEADAAKDASKSLEELELG